MVQINHIDLFHLVEAAKQWLLTYPDSPNVRLVERAIKAAQTSLYPEDEQSVKLN